MCNEIIIEHQGKSYVAEYFIVDDTLTVTLPDGSQRTSELRGLKPETAAKTHLKIYVQKTLNNAN